MNVFAQTEKHTQWALQTAQSIEFAKHSCETNSMDPLNSKTSIRQWHLALWRHEPPLKSMNGEDRLRAFWESPQGEKTKHN